MVTITKEITTCYDCPDKVPGYEGRACCKHLSDRRYGMEWRSEGVRDDCPYKKAVAVEQGKVKRV